MKVIPVNRIPSASLAHGGFEFFRITVYYSSDWKLW
jgi:hypothetical protein